LVLISLFALAVFGSVIVALGDWRRGIFAATLIGMIQDPVRKLVPGTPALLVLSSVPVWLMVYLGVLRHERGIFAAVRRAHPGLVTAARLFAISLAVPTVLAFRYGFAGWQLAVLGLFSYLSPLYGVLVGYAFARTSADARKLVVFYGTASACMLVGTGLEYLEVAPDWGALGTRALGAQWVRYIGGSAVVLFSGFFRSPDIMGWHAAALAIFALTVLLARRSAADRVWLVFAIEAACCLLVSGRRKMIIMPVVWAAVVALSLVRAGRVGRLIAMAILAAVVSGSVYYAAGELEVHESYYTYAGSAASEGQLRLVQETWTTVIATYNQVGALGQGIGSASQGARYLDVSASSWQESGPSKIMAELGVPGFVCGAVLALAVARALMRAARMALSSRDSPFLAVGLIGFVVANAACFTISHQVYSDAVILSLTSLMLGGVLGAHRWQGVAQATVPEPRPQTWTPVVAGAGIRR
jgi:hypothetical protein